ncbi:MAG: hypothetical protein MJ237_08645 [bacterium]|nr:hypothetical protein [bacterium]
MKLFKNYKTKKELKKEIDNLKETNSKLVSQLRFNNLVRTTTIQKQKVEELKCSKLVHRKEQLDGVEEYIVKDFAEALKPYIEFSSEIENGFTEEPIVKVVGTLKVVKER